MLSHLESVRNVPGIKPMHGYVPSSLVLLTLEFYRSSMPMLYPHSVCLGVETGFTISAKGEQYVQGRGLNYCNNVCVHIPVAILCIPVSSSS